MAPLYQSATLITPIFTVARAVPFWLPSLASTVSLYDETLS